MNNDKNNAMSKTIAVVPTPDLSQAFSAELLGQAIKARRTQSQLTLDNAAALCGVAKQTLLAIEHGKQTIKLDSILKICQGLGLTLSVSPWSNSDVQEVFDDWQ